MYGLRSFACSSPPVSTAVSIALWPFTPRRTLSEHVDTLHPVTHHMAPEGLGQLQEPSAPAQACNDFVKLSIKVHVCPHFALPDTLLSRGNILLEVVDELLMGLFNSPADGQGLDRCSDLAYFIHFPVTYGAYLVADPWYRLRRPSISRV